MLIAQITDMHVKRPGSPALEGVDTAACLERCVAHINAMERQPDVVLATGDLVAEGSAEEYAILRRALAPLRAPLYVIPGNHDDRDRLREAFSDHDYLPKDSPFLHYVIEGYPVRLIALDTVIPGEDGGRLCAERLAWLEARLAAAPPDRPTVIFMHHPPFVTGMDHLDRIGCEGGAALGAVIARNPQVERILCGHIHRPIQVRWHGTIASTGPSTGLQMALELRPDGPFRWSFEPPACQLHLYRPEVGVISHLSYIGDFDRPQPTTPMA